MTETSLFHGEEYATPLSEPFWTALHERRLTFQHCVDCGRFQHYPRLFCSHCGSDDWRWDAASGQGSVFAVTTVHRTTQPSLVGKVPFLLAIVRMDEGPLLMALAPDTKVPPSGGSRVEIDFTATATSGLLTVKNLER